MGLRRPSLAAAAGLLAIGLFCASPFFHRGLVGTGESYNYSLSVADAVSQMRHGVIPPLAGQTEYAFNGRIHPLRNAPYLHYLCAAIDLATLHRLPFWELQNISLVISLLGALLGCYAGLRWATPCSRPTAVFLSSVYALGPPLLGAAFTFDLYMTVHAAAFVPLALAACVKGCRNPSFSVDAWMAAALAAAWLAHPPVAFWLTLCIVAVRVVAFIGRPRLGILASALAAAVLGLALSAFVFASASTLSDDLGFFDNNPVIWSHFADVIVEGLKGNALGSLLPVSAGAGKLSDLQLGYASWCLLALAIAALLRSARSGLARAGGDLAALGCALAALALLAVDLPLPLLTHAIWQHMPPSVLSLTTQWPMQRLYLLAVGLCVFAAGSVLPERWAALRVPRWLAPAAMAAGFCWVAFQATPFIRRGFGDRIPPGETEGFYRSSNVDLTITSYAFVGPPPTYIHGVQDPRFDFRLLGNGTDEIASPYSAGLAGSPVTQTGALRAAGGLLPGKLATSPGLTLAPGHRYLLEFAFRIPPAHAILILKGPYLNRTYILPEAGQPKGFGMMDGQRRAIPLWTDSAKPEHVEMSILMDDHSAVEGKPQVFADYFLHDVDMASLPVRLESLLPLRFSVDAPQAGCTVETPRRFIPGYVATVNGKPSTALMSPYRQVMIPVPAGRSTVVLEYRGPLLAVRAFWVSAASWLVFLLWRLSGSWLPRNPRELAGKPIKWLWRQRWSVVALCVAALFAVRARRIEALSRAADEAVGPVRVDFRLPYAKTGVNEPLLASGHMGAGVVIFAHMLDGSHISIGADVWGALFESEAIAIDFSQVHTLVVSDGALFPPGNPRLKLLSPEEIQRLRSELVVELDGRTVIRKTVGSYESTPAEVLAGRTNFGSLTPPTFDGSIERFERLPISRLLMVPPSRHARLVVRFPEGRLGKTEPLVEAGTGRHQCQCSATYLSDGLIELSLSAGGAGPFVRKIVPYDQKREHTLEFWPTYGEPEKATLSLSCTFDGSVVFGPVPAPAFGQVPVLQTGLNSLQAPGVEARFTGQRLFAELTAEPGIEEAASDFGAGELVVTFPLDKTGRQEPLLTTGAAGRGDFIYVVYVDSSHIRLGFDHWGGGASALSEPVEVDYHSPHAIWISAAPLYPEASPDPAASRTPSADLARLRSRVTVMLDGRSILSTEAKTYPSSPAEVTFGENLIGGSTADPRFTGVIHFEHRIAPSALFR